MTQSEVWIVRDGTRVFEVPTTHQVMVFLNGLRLAAMDEYCTQTGLDGHGVAVSQTVTLRRPTYDARAVSQPWWRRMWYTAFRSTPTSENPDVVRILWENTTDDTKEVKAVMTVTVTQDGLQSQVCPKCTAEIVPLGRQTIEYQAADPTKALEERLFWRCPRCGYGFTTPCADATAEVTAEEHSPDAPGGG